MYTDFMFTKSIPIRQAEEYCDRFTLEQEGLFFVEYVTILNFPLGMYVNH